MAITFDDVIERFRSTSLSNRERGDKFEALVQRYLKLDPRYAQRFTHVWRWSEWPERGREPDRYIVDLLKRIVTVSLETMAIVDALPELSLDAP